MSDQERGGLIKLGLAGGLLYLFVTGGLQGIVAKLQGGVSGAYVAKPYPIRDLIAKHSAVATAGRL